MSAIATLLGLLIVVTFIANYLATTLPNTMGQNDLQHELAVENEVSELSARAEAVAAKDAVGAQVSQPLTLGSLGAPPFAGPDGGSLTPLATVANTSGNYPASSVSFALTGSTTQVSFNSTGLSGFVVRMTNTYVPSSEVGYDQGAVVYAQPGSVPLFIEGPPISFAHGILQLFLPWFQGIVPGESGTGTADLSLRLLSAESLSFPSKGFAFTSGSSITITVVTPYAAAWYAFYQAQSAFTSYVTCSGSNSVCTAFYNPNGPLPLGTVTLTIPVKSVTTFNLLIGVFAASLT